MYFCYIYVKNITNAGHIKGWMIERMERRCTVWLNERTCCEMVVYDDGVDIISYVISQ